jgi:Spy/CpxP family protein refolding chaperone
MNARLIVGSLMLAASTALFAQAQPAPSPSDGHKGRHHGEMRPCAKEADPAKCEAQRKEMREKMQGQMKEAREACKGKEGADRGKCMTQTMCAKAPDPAKCEAHAKERKEHRHEKHEMRKKEGAQAAPKT